MRRAIRILCASMVLAGVPMVGTARASGPAAHHWTGHDTAHDAPAVARAISPSRLTFIGTLIVPRLKLRAPIYSGNTDAVFDVGLGHWPGTAIPGRPGNSVIGGHRTGGRMQFVNIHKLKKNDRIIAQIGKKRFTYRVTGIRIVKPTATDIVLPARDTRLTLYTCHPPHSVKFRYVVTAMLGS